MAAAGTRPDRCPTLSEEIGRFVEWVRDLKDDYGREKSRRVALEREVERLKDELARARLVRGFGR